MRVYGFDDSVAYIEAMGLIAPIYVYLCKYLVKEIHAEATDRAPSDWFFLLTPPARNSEREWGECLDE